ncbi:MAG: uracil-DNA glycosylase [Fusobacteria bacterium]|nr:MAG: uracil-DNA glycosylase [Fusobacteriota bacterium]
MEKRNEFLLENKIHSSYYEFFTLEIVEKIEVIFSKIENYTPSKEDVFKVFRKDLNDVKVVLLGMDPYPQKGVATGRSFEVKKDNWADKGVNTSLKNILKLIYKTYMGEIPTIKLLREKIESEEFNILSPKDLFNSWESQGVLLLNVGLTVEIGKSGSHIKYWKPITEKLLRYLEMKNKNLIFLLWGQKAINYKKNLKNSVIIEHNHPAICGNLKNPNDFLNGESFEKTKNIIEWRGIKGGK